VIDPIVPNDRLFMNYFLVKLIDRFVKAEAEAFAAVELQSRPQSGSSRFSNRARTALYAYLKNSSSSSATLRV
jgi:hypothetical protein